MTSFDNISPIRHADKVDAPSIMTSHAKTPPPIIAAMRPLAICALPLQISHAIPTEHYFSGHLLIDLIIFD